MSLTAALGSAGTGQQVTWKGRLYTLMPVDLRKEQAFEEWLKGRARQELLACKGLLEPEDFRAAVAEFAAIAAVKFTFLGEEGRKARRTLDGIVKVLHLMLSDRHPGMEESQVRELFQDEPEQVEAVLKAFFPKDTAETTTETPPATENGETPPPTTMTLQQYRESTG